MSVCEAGVDLEALKARVAALLYANMMGASARGVCCAKSQRLPSIASPTGLAVTIRMMSASEVVLVR